VPGPGPGRTAPRVQPVQAALKFHPNNSFDSDSVCSGTFTIDLNTLQSIQNRVQPPPRAPPPPVNQPDHPSRNNRRPRPHTSLSVKNPPEPGPSYDHHRVTYSYPRGRQMVGEHQAPPAYFVSGGRQFNDRVTSTDERRTYPAVPRARYDNFAAETARRDYHRDYNNDYDGNPPHRYEPAPYSAARDGGYRYQPHDGSNEYPAADTDVLPHARPDGYRLLPRFSNDGFPDGGRGDERGQLQVRNVDDDPAALYRSSAAADRGSYPAPRFNGVYEGYRAPMKSERYEHVPTRDDLATTTPPPPATMTGGFPYNETQQWRWQQSGSGRAALSSSQTPSYPAAPRGTAHLQHIAAERSYESVSDAAAGRYLPPANNVETQPVASRQEPKDRWKQTRFQDEQPTIRPARSSSVTRHESELQSQGSVVQSRQYAARDTNAGIATEPPTPPSLKSQSFRTSSDIPRGDPRMHADHSSSTAITKDLEPSPSSSSSGGKYTTAYPPGFPQNVPDARRSSGYQDGRRSTAGPTDKRYTQVSDNRGSSSVPGSQSESPVSDVKREDRGRRVKFQSDPDLSHKDDSTTTPLQPVKDFRRSAEVKPTYSGTAVTSGAGTRQSSDRRYQSAESLQSSTVASPSRDQVDREYSTAGRQYSSQTSLLAQSRSAAGATRQTVHRAGSFDQVDRAGDRTRANLRERAARSRDSSRDRRRVLPRAPLQPHRRLSDDDDDASSSVIRDVATEIARMTSSVNNLDAQPPDRRTLLDATTSSTSRHYGGGVRGSSQTEDVGRLAASTSDLVSYSSASSALGIHERLQEQKRKKTETRRQGLNGGRGEASLLAQIQDDLQSEIDRYGAQLDSATRPMSRSVVCEEDLNASAAETGNIVNTALIDSRVGATTLLEIILFIFYFLFIFILFICRQQ